MITKKKLMAIILNLDNCIEIQDGILEAHNDELVSLKRKATRLENKIAKLEKKLTPTPIKVKEKTTKPVVIKVKKTTKSVSKKKVGRPRKK